MRENTPTRWHRWATLAALFLAWAVLAMWQWQEYQAEREAARESLRRQADSVMNALVGGVKSHRRLGRFLEEQLQGALDELAESQDVLAVAVISTNRRLSWIAGKTDLLNLSAPIEPGHFWDADGFRYAVVFQVSPEMPGPGMGPGMRPNQGRGPGPGMRRGPGPDMGRGQGRGGPGMGFNRRPAPQDEGLSPMGGRFHAVLLLDRTRTDQQIAHYAWLRIFVVAAGGLVILSVALAWRATVRLAEARGHAQLLEIEARHLRDLSRAAAGLAHETRSPLGLIRGWTQRWMQTLSDHSQQRQQAQAVIEECDRVTVRINQFLAFVRPRKPKIEVTPPAEVVGELAAMLEPDLDAKRLTLVPVFPAQDSTIQADREMFRQALFNLIQNAVEFAPEGGTVEIALRTGPNGAARLEVADRGPGVPDERMELLFTPYHTTRSGGTGLGLAIVRRIAAAHGWTAGYSPRPDGGSIFWLDGIHS